jgi:hypothetical protein
MTYSACPVVRATVDTPAAGPPWLLYLCLDLASRLLQHLNISQCHTPWSAQMHLSIVSIMVGRKKRRDEALQLAAREQLTLVFSVRDLGHAHPRSRILLEGRLIPRGRKLAATATVFALLAQHWQCAYLLMEARGFCRFGRRSIELVFIGPYEFLEIRMASCTASTS